MQSLVMLSQRFRGLSGNPNTLQFLSVIAIAILVSLYFKHYTSKIAMFSLVIYFAIIGLLTMSKAFIVCFMILTLIYFILMFRRNKKQSWKELGIFVVVSTIIILIFFDKFKSIFSRFFIYGYDNPLDNILTGRFSLWEKYLKYWSSSILTIIFGCGVSHEQPFSLGPHSGYVDIVYKFGLLGIILICLLVYSYLKETKQKKRKIFFCKFYSIINVLNYFY